jgi:hypothetical protein
MVRVKERNEGEGLGGGNWDRVMGRLAGQRGRGEVLGKSDRPGTGTAQGQHRRQRAQGIISTGLTRRGHLRAWAPTTPMAAPRLQGRPPRAQQPAAATRPGIRPVCGLVDSAMAHAGARWGRSRAPPKRALAVAAGMPLFRKMRGRVQCSAVQCRGIESSAAEPQRRSATQQREAAVCAAVGRCEAAAATASAPAS